MGQCQGILVDEMIVTDGNGVQSCLDACNVLDACRWFT